MDAKYEGWGWGERIFPKCCHLLYRLRPGLGCSRDCTLTNLQIPVDNPVNMAVMDTLEDLLYAVAAGRREMIVME